ncbi:MAG: RecQ family ATP-dependent DNA helicase [Paludibacteraceae bacterium]|jgi:ATP-dependent DNA helicase RecQ|nr:RecQ family ATP-dependent DNA helicase [Paludibacteraceae bacterium]
MDNSASKTIYHNILKQYWGYDDFRPLQLDIIKSIGSGKDTLGLMPTGGGKSITFQVPTLAMNGICIVITPLIALMKDQVENLRQKGIKATAIYSGMQQSDILTALDNCELGDYKFLYVSPERLGTDLFLKRLKFLKICMIAVDESHCISQWGYDFRPAYLKIAEIRKFIPQVPILALTATATPEVADDIQKRLLFKENNLLQKSFERKNLVYVVRETEDKLSQLLNILKKVSGTSVVYVRSRKKTKEISDFLTDNHIPSDYFHAGLDNTEKDKKQAAWKNGTCRVIVATNAFGMGIDKADVRSVIHMDLPDSLEAYFQEAGRAGRDEKRAYAVLLYNNTDKTKLQKRIADTFPEPERIKNVYQALGNFFQLGVQSGLDLVFPFNLQYFCLTFHFPITPTYNALKILELAGYIELTEELDNPSKLMFTVDKNELYNLRSKDPDIDQLIEVILRSYTGVFADMIHINEEIIAQRLNTTREHVYDQLTTLSKLHIINYIPFKKTPFLIYKIEREFTEKIVLPDTIYKTRKERYIGRINKVLEYATATNICRSQILLNYFGQKNNKPCGQCDICLAHKANKITTQAFNQLTNTICCTLQKNPQSIKQLVSQINGKEDKITQAVRILLDEGKIKQNEQMLLELNSKKNQGTGS